MDRPLPHVWPVSDPPSGPRVCTLATPSLRAFSRFSWDWFIVQGFNSHSLCHHLIHSGLPRLPPPLPHLPPLRYSILSSQHIQVSFLKLMVSSWWYRGWASWTQAFMSCSHGARAGLAPEVSPQYTYGEHMVEHQPCHHLQKKSS